MKLYTFYRSSCAWRVRIALAFKNIPFEPVYVHLLRGGGEQLSDGFAALNPLAQVPVLEVPSADGSVTRLTQSLAILEYLEETHPTPSLLPKEPLLRAEARRMAEVVNSGMQPFQNLALGRALKQVNVDPAPITKAYLEQGLAALEGFAQATAGRYLVGDAPSFADVCLVPQLLGVRRVGIDVSRYPTLARVEALCREQPAFQAAAPEAQADYES
jgi:maleylpyruvate isomerase